VWSDGGLFLSHSINDRLISEFITGRFAVIASQMIYLNINTATTEICLPIEETTFHEVNASG
jgi:hypothetical protein